MHDKSKKILRRMIFLSMFAGFWNLFFVINETGRTFFGVDRFRLGSGYGVVVFSCLMLLITSFELCQILKYEEGGTCTTCGLDRKVSRFLVYMIILSFSGFVLWFLWVKVFSRL